MPSSRLRRWADRWAERVLDLEESERLLADLREEYEVFVRPERGRLRSDLWYGKQVVFSVGAMRAEARAIQGWEGRARG